MKKISIVCICLMMMALIMLPLQQVNALTNKELDVVLVLDQSGSMKTNDENNLMKEAAKTFVTMMPSNSRINVISFNLSRSTWQDYLTTLDSDTTIASATSWIDAIEYTGDTDVGNAVADAIDMFDDSDDTVKAILVFSDGRNDFGYDRNAEVESDERLDDALSEAKNNDIQIYCIGYGEEMANTSDTPYQKLDSIAIADSDNRITTKTDASSISEYFNTVIAELLGSNVVDVVNNQIEIADNVKEANINITCDEDISTIGLELLDDEGNTVTFDGSNAKLFTYTYSAVIKLYDPTPGIYTIQTNKDVEISATYIPYYDFTLDVSLLNGSSEVTSVNSGETVTINVKVKQEDTTITDFSSYNDVKAYALITALDNDDSSTIDLSLSNGSFTGNYTFDHEATYQIDVYVSSDSFDLSSSSTIQANAKAIYINDNIIEKQVLDKTFKSSVTKTVDTTTLNSVISDEDNVGYKIDNVESSDSDKVEVKLVDDGLELTGKSWGSAHVTVTYKDNHGNSVDYTFSVKVSDKALVALFAAIPILIGLIIVLIVLFIMSKSKIIKGSFTVNEIQIEDHGHTTIIATEKTYPSNVFLRRKKTLGTGLSQYARDLYNMTFDEDTQNFYELMNEDSMIKEALDMVKFKGTYLGLKGCQLVIKKNNHVSYGNQYSFNKSSKHNLSSYSQFTIYVQDDQGMHMSVTLTYAPKPRRKKQDDFNEEFDFEQTTSNDDFDDFTF
ncbi:MAG: VWA domain-containing protein [Erysipelotrichaceae bacterium]|nr:VWA domain-containing protein [Erysipelotrichaceae bacterium]